MGKRFRIHTSIIASWQRTVHAIAAPPPYDAGDPAKIDPGICGCGVNDNANYDNDTVPDCLDQCPGADDAIYAPECTIAIPTTTAWGGVVLSLLLLTIAKIRYARYRRAGIIAP